jgi:hypothetical protein
MIRNLGSYIIIPRLLDNYQVGFEDGRLAGIAGGGSHDNAVMLYSRRW